MVASKLTWFLCGRIWLRLVWDRIWLFCAGDRNWLCAGRNRLVVSVVIDRLGFCVGGRNRLGFWDAGRKSLGFCVSIEIDLVVVWVVEIDVILVGGSEFQCMDQNWLRLCGGRKKLGLESWSKLTWFSCRGDCKIDLFLELGSKLTWLPCGVEITSVLCGG